MSDQIPSVMPPNKDETLRLIVEGTAAVTGSEFFRAMVIHLAKALNARYAWVCEFAGSSSRVRTLAFCSGSECIPNFEYDLGGVPCEQVYSTGSLCLYREHLQSLFPQDKDLVTINAESYLGVPLIATSGETLGHLAVIDVKPMSGAVHDLSIFRIFAARACAELQRERAENIILEHEAKLSGILESAMDAIVTIDDQKRVSLFNRAAESVFAIGSEAMIGHSFETLMPDKFRQLINKYIGDINKGGESLRKLWIPEGLTAYRANHEEFPAEASISYFEVENQKFFTIILRDINERAKAESQIRQLQMENLLLQEELKSQHNLGELVGE